MAIIDNTAYYYLSGIMTGVLWGTVIGLWVAGDSLSINVPFWVLLSVISTSILISILHVVGLERVKTILEVMEE